MQGNNAQAVTAKELPAQKTAFVWLLLCLKMKTLLHSQEKKYESREVWAFTRRKRSLYIQKQVQMEQHLGDGTEGLEAQLGILLPIAKMASNLLEWT